MSSTGIVGGSGSGATSFTATSSGSATGTSSSGGSVTAVPPASGYQSILATLTAPQLLGLSSPLSAGDMSAMIGEVTAFLQQTLAQNKQNSEEASTSSQALQIAQIEQYLLHLQMIYTQISSDQSSVAADQTSASKLTAAESSDWAAMTQLNMEMYQTTSSISSLQTQIASDEQKVKAGTLSQSVVDTETAQLASLNTQLQTEKANYSNLSADFASKWNQVQTLNQDISALTSDENSLNAQASSDLGAIADTLASINIAQDTSLSSDQSGSAIESSIESFENASGALLNSQLATSQTQQLVLNMLAAVVSVASLGLASPQAGVSSPQVISSSSVA